MAPDPGFCNGLFDDYSSRTTSQWQVVPGSLRILPEQVFPAAPEPCVPDRGRAGWRAWLHAIALRGSKYGRHRPAGRDHTRS